MSTTSDKLPHGLFQRLLGVVRRHHHRDPLAVDHCFGSSNGYGEIRAGIASGSTSHTRRFRK